jgi:heptosyltransferase-2
VARLFSLRPNVSTEQAVYLRGFDLIISYLYDPDGTVKRNMLAVGARQVVHGSPIVERTHAVEHLMKPLEELAIYPEGEACPRAELSPEQARRGRRRLEAFGERVIAIHPGSGSARKNWPLAGFCELAGILRAEGMGVPVFTVGEADVELERELARRGSNVAVLRGCSLPELAEALGACRGYVGNDSGVTHLAAAVGTPVVALFGPTDPRLWAPRGRNVRVVPAPQPAGLAGLSVEDVAAEVRDAFGRLPPLAT